MGLGLKLMLITSSLMPLYILMFLRVLLFDNYSDITLNSLFNLDPSSVRIWYLIALLFMIALGLALMFYYRLKERTITNRESSFVKTVEDESNVGLDFFITLIIPLVMMDASSVSSIILFAAILTILYALMYRTRLLYANPVLIIMGFTSYKVSLDSSDIVHHVISRNELVVDDQIAMLDMSERVHIAYLKG